MPHSAPPPRLPAFARWRALRLRLAIFYLAFFSLFLVAVGFVLRQTVKGILTRDLQAAIEEEWAAAKGYMNIVNHRPEWSFDRFDPEEALIVERIRGGAYLVMDSEARVLDVSVISKDLPLDTLAQVKDAIRLNQPIWMERQDSEGTRYQLRAGIIFDETKQPYYMVIGRAQTEIQTAVAAFTRYYSLGVPLALLVAGALGWLVARRALQPLNEVAHAAQQITSHNLNVQIPVRGAGDELDELITAFNGMTSRLDRSFEQIRQFSTDVSHELRTPLTVIRGQLEVALFTAETPEQYREAIYSALQDVEQLSNIVRALLLLSQAESGQLALQFSSFDLREQLSDLVEQFQIPAEEQGLTLNADLGSAPVTLKADRTQMGRLFTNLLSNALKYTPAGGTITVRLHPQANGVTFQISDTGLGIPPENLPHIFDRFYRVRNPATNRLQGLGLGLSFVAWIVKAHNGEIHVDSTVGQGTTFTVRLPANPDARLETL